MLKVKDLKKILEEIDDEVDIGIEINETIFDCCAYDDNWCRKAGHPCLVIAKE
jgi:hypothetical protein